MTNSGAYSLDPPAIRRTCLAVDIESYSARSTPEQVDLQNRLMWTMTHACRAAGVSPARCDRQDSGDGEILILPPDLDGKKGMSGLILGLLSALSRVNEAPGAGGRMRMRVSLGQGIVQVAPTGFASQALIVVARLLDCAELRQALKDSPAADAALIVTGDLYQDLFAQGFGGLPAGDFREVHVAIPAKNFSGTGWMQVPADPPGLPVLPAYEDDPALTERQLLLRAGGAAAGTATAAGLAWAAAAGAGNPHLEVGKVDAALVGLVDHEADLTGLEAAGGHDRPATGDAADHATDLGSHGGAGPGEPGHAATSGDSWAAGHADRGQDAHGHAPAGATSPAYTTAADSAYESTNTQTALQYDTGQDEPAGGLAEQAVAYETAYGYTAAGNPYATYAVAAEYSDGSTHAAEYEQVTEEKTASGYELDGYKEVEVDTPGHQDIGYEHVDEQVGYDASGHEYAYEVTTYEVEDHAYGAGYDDTTDHHPGEEWTV